MGLIISLLYVALSLLSPKDVLPFLGEARILAVLAVVATLVSLPVLSQHQRVLTATQFRLMLLFVGVVLFSWLPHGWIGGVRRPLDEFIPIVMVYFLAVSHIRTVRALEATRAVLVCSALFILSQGIPNYYIAQRTHETMPYVLVQEFAFATHCRLQGLGVLADPNMFGQFLLMLIPMLFVGKERGKMSLGWLVSIPIVAIFAYGIFLTGSRGAVLGSIVLAGLYFRERFRNFGTVVAAFAGVIIVALVNASSKRDISVSGGLDRLSLWSDGFGLLKHSPVWGIGYHGFAADVGMTAHNTFLLCVVELGIVGLFVWMGVVVMTFAQLNYVTRLNGASPEGYPPPDPALQRWAAALKKSLIVYLFTGYFLSDTYELLLYWLLGMAGAVFFAQVEARREKTVPVYPKWKSIAALAAVGIVAVIYISVRVRAV